MDSKTSYFSFKDTNKKENKMPTSDLPKGEEMPPLGLSVEAEVEGHVEETAHSGAQTLETLFSDAEDAKDSSAVN